VDSKKTNQSILKELKIKNRLSTIIKHRILKYFGHTIRQDGLKKLVLQGKVEESRGKRRSATEYTDNNKSNKHISDTMYENGRR